MKYVQRSVSVFIFLLQMVSIFIFYSCKKEEPKVSIVLHDKPLDVIKSYIQGKWKLQKVTGGICGGCYPPVKNHPYMIINNDHIIAGNDSAVTLDTIIVWRRDKDIFNDSTYLLSYDQGSIHLVVDQISDGTLILIDNASDAFYYSYTK